jgi:hypothetical protein
MFFEEHPWLLVPVIIVTVEAWGAAKALFVAWHKRRAANRT